MRPANFTIRKQWGVYLYTHTKAHSFLFFGWVCPSAALRPRSRAARSRGVRLITGRLFGQQWTVSRSIMTRPRFDDLLFHWRKKELARLLSAALCIIARSGLSHALLKSLHLQPASWGNDDALRDARKALIEREPM